MLMIGIDTGQHPDESPAPAASNDFVGVDFVVGAHGADLSLAPGLWSRRLGVLGPFPGQPPLGTATVTGRTLALTLPASLIEDPVELELKVMVGREWVASPPPGETTGEEADVWPDAGYQHIVLVR